jgi:hypothetical protein
MGRSFLLQTLSHTPAWVYAVLILLVFFGHRQNRGRTISRGGLAARGIGILRSA